DRRHHEPRLRSRSGPRWRALPAAGDAGSGRHRRSLCAVRGAGAREAEQGLAAAPRQGHESSVRLAQDQARLSSADATRSWPMRSANEELMANTALVVGATGIVGGAVARLLAASGWTVIGLSRTPTADKDVIPLQADLRDAASLTAALAAQRPTH